MFSDRHPTSTASTGKSILKSTFIQPGDPIENFIECAQCGRIKNLDKEMEGPSTESDTSDGPGVVNVAVSFTTKNTLAQLPQPLKSLSQNYIGTFSVVEPRNPAGCLFCGSLNSKAVGRDSDPFECQTRDLRNLW